MRFSILKGPVDSPGTCKLSKETLWINWGLKKDGGNLHMITNWKSVTLSHSFFTKERAGLSWMFSMNKVHQNRAHFALSITDFPAVLETFLLPQRKPFWQTKRHQLYQLPRRLQKHLQLLQKAPPTWYKWVQGQLCGRPWWVWNTFCLVPFCRGPSLSPFLELLFRASPPVALSISINTSASIHFVLCECGCRDILPLVATSITFWISLCLAKRHGKELSIQTS